MDTKQILIKVLDIIDYQEDKEQFADDFIKLAYDTTNIEVMTELSPEDKKKLEEEMLNLQDITQTHLVMNKYIPIMTYKKHLERVTEKLLTDYFMAIEPTLTDEQIDKLVQLLPKTES